MVKAILLDATLPLSKCCNPAIHFGGAICSDFEADKGKKVPTFL